MLVKLQVESTQVLQVNHGVFKEANSASIGFGSFIGRPIRTVKKYGRRRGNFAEFFQCQVLSLKVNKFLKEFNLVLAQY